MATIKECWVIQREDGKFCVNSYAWCYDIYNASMFGDKVEANMAIRDMNLQNCRPVKVKIEVCDE